MENRKPANVTSDQDSNSSRSGEKRRPPGASALRDGSRVLGEALRSLENPAGREDRQVLPVGCGDTSLAAEEAVAYAWEKGQEIAEGFSPASWVMGTDRE